MLAAQAPRFVAGFRCRDFEAGDSFGDCFEGEQFS